MKSSEIKSYKGSKCIVNYLNPPRENGFGKGSKNFRTTEVFRFESMANALVFFESSLDTIRKAVYNGSIIIENGRLL